MVQHDATNPVPHCRQCSTTAQVRVQAWSACPWRTGSPTEKCAPQQPAAGTRGGVRLGRAPSALGRSRCCSHASSPLSTLLAKACFRKGPRMGVYAGAMRPCAASLQNHTLQG